MKKTIAAMTMAASMAANAGITYWTPGVSDGGGMTYAKTETDGAHSVVVTFFPHNGCHSADLVIYGEYASNTSYLSVDGETWKGKATYRRVANDGTPYTSFDGISKSALNALKQGNHATLLVGSTRYSLPLLGSADALNQAWAACEVFAGNPNPSTKKAARKLNL